MTWHECVEIIYYSRHKIIAVLACIAFWGVVAWVVKVAI